MLVQKALVLAAHTDDGEMGCGATVARLVEDGAEVWQAAFSAGNAATGVVPQEWDRALQILGIGDRVWWRWFNARHFDEYRQEILDFMIKVRGRSGPFDAVFCPSSWDRHQDHQVVRAEAIRAFPRTTLLGYEMPGSCDGFHPRCLWPVERRHVERKWAALECYHSQRVRAYMRKEIVWGLACIRGMQAGVQYGEGFEVIRWVQP